MVDYFRVGKFDLLFLARDSLAHIATKGVFLKNGKICRCLIDCLELDRFARASLVHIATKGVIKKREK